MVTLTIETDNAAFEGSNIGPEIARILRETADRIEDEHLGELWIMCSMPIVDINGNVVGDITIERNQK